LGFQPQAATAGLGFKRGVRVAIRCRSLAERRPEVVAIARCSSNNDTKLGFGAHELLAYECVCFCPWRSFANFFIFLFLENSRQILENKFLFVEKKIQTLTQLWKSVYSIYSILGENFSLFWATTF
jgi:hypothetical protein